MREAFSAILTASLAGSMAILALIAISPLTKRFFSSRWHYYAWILALTVLVLPIKIEHRAHRSVNIQNMPILRVVENMGAEGGERGVQSVGASIDFAEILAFIWAAVVLLLIAAKIANYARFIRKMKKSAKETYLKDGVKVYECGGVFSPFAAGLIKRAVFMPKLGEEEKNYALRHETEHIRRGDVYIKWFATIIKCVHWFNPAVYFAARKIDAECEISCDEAAVSGMSREEREKYVETILSIAEGCAKKRYPLSANMTGKGKILKRRIDVMKNERKIGKAAKIVSVVSAAAIFAAAVCAGGFIAGGEAAAETESAKTEAFLWPLPESGTISARFGEREHPITGKKLSHTGIDISAPEGTKVVSALAGKVADAGFDAEMGNYVKIESGEYTCLYSHLKTSSVKNGDNVSRGGAIGEVGNTGKSTGSHLHFEVYNTKDGTRLDPESFYPPAEEATLVTEWDEEAGNWIIKSGDSAPAEEATAAGMDEAVQSLMEMLDLAGHEYEIKSVTGTKDGKTAYVEIRPENFATNSNDYLTVIFKDDRGVLSVKDYYLEK